jgi:hypothetical protein
MVTKSKTIETVHLTLDQSEAAELLRLLEHTLGETRVEVHRTHTPLFRAEVQHEEQTLKSVLQKLNSARS